MADDMCPNCLTPWKCNGPHDPMTAEQTSSESCNECGHEKARHRDDGCYFSGSKASCRCAFRGGR